VPPAIGSCATTPTERAALALLPGFSHTEAIRMRENGHDR
jgi:hypothetical protein